MPPENLPFELVENQTRGAVRLGLSLDKLLSDSFIERQHGDARDQVTAAQYLLLCLNTMIGVDDAGHGLAKTGLAPALPLIGLRMALAYASLGDALNGLSSFYALASNSIRIQLSCSRATATVSVLIDSWEQQDAAHVEEAYLGWLYMKCVQFLGYAPTISRVTLRNPTHFNLGRRHWATGGIVSYGTVTSLTLPRRLLALPPALKGGPHLFWECNWHWLEISRSVTCEPQIADYFNGGDIVRFSDIVKASGKSANSVRYGLQAAGVGGYRETRRQTLVNAATCQLYDTQNTVESVAANCGFSDGRGFRRFLKNATGLTPRQFRINTNNKQLSNDSLALDRLKELTQSMSI